MVSTTEGHTGMGSTPRDSAEPWAVGVDLGGTKVLVASVGGGGEVWSRIGCKTEATAGVQPSR